MKVDPIVPSLANRLQIPTACAEIWGANIEHVMIWTTLSAAPIPNLVITIRSGVISVEPVYSTK